MTTPTSPKLRLRHRSVLHLGNLQDESQFEVVTNQDVSEWLSADAGPGSLPRWPGENVVALSPTITVTDFQCQEPSGKGLRRITVTEGTEDNTFVTRVYAIPQADGPHFGGTVVVDGLAALTDTEGPAPTYDPSHLTNLILTSRDVTDGAVRLSPDARLIYEDDEAAVQEAYKAIMDPRRNVTVVIAEADPSREDWEHVRRAADLHSPGETATFTLWPDAMATLNEMLPEHLRVPHAAARTYLPGVDAADTTDGMRHGVFSHGVLARWFGHHSSVSPESEDPGPPLAGPRTQAPAALQATIREIDDAAAKAERRELARERTRSRRARADLGSQPLEVAVPAHWWDHLRGLFQKWLGAGRGTRIEAVPEDLDALDALIEEKEHLVNLAEEANSAHARQIAELETRVARTRKLAEDRQIEVHERQEEIDDLLRRSEYYRAQLVSLQRADLLAKADEDDGWEPPADMEELTGRLRAGSGWPAAEYVRFTSTQKSVRPFAVRDPWGTMARDAWNMVRALHDYAQMKAEGSFTGNVHDYLAADGVTGFQISAHRHASRESSQVEGNQRWFQSRVFSVPAEVNPSGRAYMGEHFRIPTRDSFAPRMHFLDDTAQTGRVYIGYIGKHLPNTRSD